MVEIDHDFQVTRRRVRRLVHDRDLFLLGSALERVTQSEEPGGDDCSGRRAAKALDRSVARVCAFDFAFVVDTFDVFGLVPMDLLHAPTVCPISRGTIAPLGLACPWITGGEPMSEWAEFGGVIGRYRNESTSWWPDPVRPPAGAPNVLVVLLDDVGSAA